MNKPQFLIGLRFVFVLAMLAAAPAHAKLAAACRAHDCTSKGAAILTANGDVVAMAALTYRCEDIKCVGDYGLRIYLGSDADRAAARQTFENWAETALAKDYVIPGVPGNRLSETSVELVRR